MSLISNGFVVATMSLVVFSNASADAYVCQLPNKTRIVQSVPCSGDQKMLSSAMSGTQSLDQQNENAARARAELQRQMDVVVRQGAIENAMYGRPQQPTQQHAVPIQQPLQQPQDTYERYSNQPQVAVQPVQVQRESFTNDGRVLHQPPGSSFEYDNKGNAYHRPEGSPFSYGKGGKTCFHYGDFADCR